MLAKTNSESCDCRMDQLTTLEKKAEAQHLLFQNALRRREEGLGCVSFHQHTWNFLESCVGGCIGSAQ